MTDRELMQQALDALEGYARNCKCEGGGAPCDAAEALRARLAQPEPEPVAVVGVDLSKVHMYVGHNYVGLKPENKTAIFFKDVPKDTPLYTAPPQREWQGLTDEEMFSLWVRCPAETEDRFAFARAIEAKLKDKNEY